MSEVMTKPNQDAAVAEALKACGFDGVICFAGEDWWYHNRGHYDMQLMQRLARHVPVLFINSVVMQKPRLSDGKALWKKIKRKLKSIRRGLVQVHERFFVYSPLSVPMHHRSWGRWLNRVLLRRQVSSAARKLGIRSPLVWIECPGACHAALKLRRGALVYQRTDRHEEFRSEEGGYVDENIRRYDETLRAESDLVVYVSKALHDEELGASKNAFLSDHGVDYERFASAHENASTPSDLENVQRPVVGFFGAIDDHTFDADFALAVARQLPELTFVFVGHATSDVEELAALPNVRLLGQRPYEQIPEYGKCFDVTIMPWLRNRWIAACNPVKLKEYLALGKPVVSTPFAQLELYGDLVRVADTPETFAEEIRAALADDSPEAIEHRRSFVEQFTWDRITADVIEHVRTLVDK